MRLFITILFLSSVFITKANGFVCNSCADVSLTRSVANEAVDGLQICDLATKGSTEAHEINKGVQSTPDYNLHLLSQFSYTAIESRHFFDAFFVSFYKYFTSYKKEARNYLNHHIASKKVLMIIYPHHSFW